MYVPSLVPSLAAQYNYLVQSRVWFYTPVEMAPGLVLKRADRVVWRDDGLGYRGRVVAVSPRYGAPHYFPPMARIWLGPDHEVLAFASELEKVE